MADSALTRQEMRVQARWTRAARSVRAGSFLASTAWPLGALAVLLLEPQSEDGATTRNSFGPWLPPEGSTR